MCQNKLRNSLAEIQILHTLSSLFFLSLSLPFFLTNQTGVLTGKTWSLSGQMTTLQSKGICKLVCNVRSCWSCLKHEVFKI